ncbi:MAG: AcrR family transcriptional regulator [Myxococcota bacterium]|jgi:AcrR family transcriptional regulator
MPPRTRFSRERILDAAIDLTRAQGIAAISARAVAGQLGCSTAPVFTRFESMEALNEAILDRIIGQFVTATNSVDGPDPLFAAGLGMVRFAADEPRLYEALFLTHHRYHFKWGPIRRALAGRMATHPRYAALSDAERFALIGRASVVVHGLGVEVWSGRLPDPSPTVLKTLLTQLAGPLVDASIARGWTTDIHSDVHSDAS